MAINALLPGHSCARAGSGAIRRIVVRSRATSARRIGGQEITF
jgi:hypothetical protein